MYANWRPLILGGRSLFHLLPWKPALRRCEPDSQANEKRGSGDGTDKAGDRKRKIQNYIKRTGKPEVWRAPDYRARRENRTGKPD